MRVSARQEANRRKRLRLAELLHRSEIGEHSRLGGLPAAHQFIEERLMPVFARQEANRRKRLGLP